MVGENISTIQKIEDYELIKNGIYQQVTELNNAKLKFALIYKATRDGFNSNYFHKFCDNKGPMVSIIKTLGNLSFGGFLNINWSDNGGDTNDNKSFLFSFNLNKIYKNNGNCACSFGKEKGPYFGYAINIYNDFYDDNHVVRTLDDTKYSWNNVEKDYELNQGKEKFRIKEIEVFQVIKE